jgi:putative ABC transport system substrate-binding protein
MASIFARLVCALLLACSTGAAVAQAAATRPYRIVMVLWRGETDVERGFRDYMTAHHVNVEYIVRNAGQDSTRLPGFVDEIHRLRPDLVYTWGTSATLGIVGPYDSPEPQRYIRDIPVVFGLVAFPVRAHIVQAMAAPPAPTSSRRNVTGVYHVARLEAQLEALRAYRPLQRLGVLYNSAEANSVAGVQEMREAARREHFQLIERTFEKTAGGAPSAEGISRLVAEIQRAGAQWLYIGPDTFLFTQLGAVAAAARQNRLPMFATTAAVFDAAPDIVAALVVPYRDVGQLAAHQAARILVQHVAPADIAVQTLARFSFSVHLQAAKALHFLPPITMFDYADLR